MFSLYCKLETTCSNYSWEELALFFFSSSFKTLSNKFSVCVHVDDFLRPLRTRTALHLSPPTTPPYQQPVKPNGKSRTTGLIDVVCWLKYSKKGPGKISPIDVWSWPRKFPFFFFVLFVVVYAKGGGEQENPSRVEPMRILFLDPNLSVYKHF